MRSHPSTPPPVIPTDEYIEYIDQRREASHEAGAEPMHAFRGYDPNLEPGIAQDWALAPPATGNTHLTEQPQAVYGTHPVPGGQEGSPEAPIHGAAHYQHYYQNWAQVSGRHPMPAIPYGVPLPDDELDYLATHGFRFGQSLGAGACGTVWRVTAARLARNPVTGQYVDREVACKVMSLAKVRRPGDTVKAATDKLLREAQLHCQLNHPNLVRCGHVFHIHDPQTGYPYARTLVFMELCVGDLKALMETLPDKHMTERQCHHVLSDVTAGLLYLHERNVCHLDVKIHNVMYTLGEDPAILWPHTFKLGDFGMSKMFQPAQVGKVFGRVGTAKYMAPEVRSGKLSEGKPMDVYSLGMCAAECLSGRYLLSGIVPALKQWSPEIGSHWGVSADCADLIARMLSPDPKARPTVGQVRHHIWFVELASD